MPREPQTTAGWLPIETAPKGGTLLLLWAPSMVEPHFGRWERQWRNNHYGDREVYWISSRLALMGWKSKNPALGRVCGGAHLHLAAVWSILRLR